MSAATALPKGIQEDEGSATAQAPNASFIDAELTTPAGAYVPGTRKWFCYLAFVLDEAGSPRRLPRPVKLEVEEGEDRAFVVYAPMLKLGGTGNTIGSAAEDLVDTALSLWDELRQTPAEQLDGSAMMLLRRLRTLFEG